VQGVGPTSGSLRVGVPLSLSLSLSFLSLVQSVGLTSGSLRAGIPFLRLSMAVRVVVSQVPAGVTARVSVADLTTCRDHFVAIYIYI